MAAKKGETTGKKTGGKHPGGRPRFPIDKKKFEDMCANQCTEKEIAARFGCSIDTVYRFCLQTYGKTFEEAFDYFRQKGFYSIRSIQFAKALSGDNTMLIWLGKQYLGQSEDPRKYERQESAEDRMAKLFTALDDVLRTPGTGAAGIPDGVPDGDTDSAGIPDGVPDGDTDSSEIPDGVPDGDTDAET